MGRRTRVVFLLFLSVILLSGCSKPAVSVTVNSAKVVEELITSLNVFLRSDLGTGNARVGSNSMAYTFPEREIIQVELNCTFIGLGESLKPGSDEHRKEIYQKILDSVTFTVAGKKVEEIWGYWPKTTGKNSASTMKLFYLIPEGTPLSDLKLTFDGAKLGDPAYSLEYTEFIR